MNTTDPAIVAAWHTVAATADIEATAHAMARLDTCPCCEAGRDEAHKDFCPMPQLLYLLSKCKYNCMAHNSTMRRGKEL